MNYEISMNKDKIDCIRVKELLNESYWASDRTLETVEKSIKHSECIGVYEGDILIGFARLLTDYATVFWLSDVVVDKRYRGKGIGKQIMNYITRLDYYKPLKGILATNDAFTLYEKYGFEKEANKFMTKQRGK